MAFPIHELIKDKSPLLVTRPAEDVSAALTSMFERDYSQLPVVDDDNKPVGMLTTDSIVRACDHLGLPPKKLKVSQAMTQRFDRIQPERDLFELLEKLAGASAVLVVDGTGRLTGIVTDFDTAEYFRRRSESMMRVEDIELSLKDHIRAAFRIKTADEAAAGQLLDGAIARSTARDDLLKDLKAAIGRDPQAMAFQKEGLHLPSLIDRVWQAMTDRQSPPAFDDLTMATYVALLTGDDQWSAYARVFHSIDRDAFRLLLDQVRETRNKLAHFRGDLSSEERERLEFVSDFLDRHQPPRFASAAITLEPVTLDAAGVVSDVENHEDDDAALTADLGQRPTTLPGLSEYLRRKGRRHSEFDVSFVEIERLTGSALPSHAREHRGWWSNDAEAQPHAHAWLDMGWRVASVRMTEQQVTFAQMLEHQQVYIRFFNDVLAELRKVGSGLRVVKRSPRGHNWQAVEDVSGAGKHAGHFGFTFSRNQIFKAELFINLPDREATKRAFDLLYAAKAEIETTFRGELQWERMDDSKASRICVSYPGPASYATEDLKPVQEWAVTAMLRLHSALAKRYEMASLQAIHGGV